MHGEVNKLPNASSLAEVSRHDVAGIWVAFFSRWQRYRCEQDFAFTLAAFLIAAEDTSFFGFSRGWYYNGTTWHDEYDKKLGKPLGDAQKKSGVHVRRFAGAVVTLDVAAHRGTVDWQAGDTRQPPPAAPGAVTQRGAAAPPSLLFILAE